MSARRPRVIRKEFTTGDGLDLGKPVNISTRFANEYPPECALDMVKSRLDYHGRPAGAPGADRRLATFSRGIWVQRLATFLFSVTIIVTASGMLSFCLFRDYCFRNKPAASPVVLVLAFPVAAVVMFCLGPLGLTAISLRMRGCMAFTVLFLVACCVTLLVGSILALTTLEPDTISRVSTAGWASLSPLEKRAYTGGIGEEIDTRLCGARLCVPPLSPCRHRPARLAPPVPALAAWSHSTPAPPGSARLPSSPCRRRAPLCD